MDRLRILGLAVALSVGLAVMTPRPAVAVDRSVTLMAPVGTVKVGDLVSIDVVLTNLNQAINAVDLTINYPTTALSMVAISRSQSALTLWPEPPSWDAATGTIRVIGGLPNGLYAKDARIVTLIMMAKQTGTAQLTLDAATSGVHLNDGRGTRAALPDSNVSLTVVSDLTPGIAVSSPTHPTPGTWYRASTVVVNWPTTPGAEYSYAWSGDGQLIPDTVPEASDGSATFYDVADGRYAFTLQSRTANGDWTNLTQRWFFVDRTAPASITFEQLAPSTVGGQMVLTWVAQDATSDVISTLRIGRHDIGLVASPLTLDPDWRGKTLTIMVTDQAGNVQFGTWEYPGTTMPWWYWTIGLGLIVVVTAGIIVARHRHYVRGIL